jgi:hypothetical protein
MFIPKRLHFAGYVATNPFGLEAKLMDELDVDHSGRGPGKELIAIGRTDSVMYCRWVDPADYGWLAEFAQVAKGE